MRLQSFWDLFSISLRSKMQMTIKILTYCHLIVLFRPMFCNFGQETPFFKCLVLPKIHYFIPEITNFDTSRCSILFGFIIGDSWRTEICEWCFTSPIWSQTIKCWKASRLNDFKIEQEYKAIDICVNLQIKFEFIIVII